MMDLRSKLKIKVHDAVVVGLEYREKLEVAFDLALAGAYRTRLVMSMPRVVGFAGFVDGSIVLDIEAYDLATECPPREHRVWEVLFPAGLWPTAEFIGSEAADRQRTAIVDRERKLGGILVLLECSLGGDFAIVCRSITGETVDLAQAALT